MKIAVIGTGYVGLTTGAAFSEFGHEVVCADTDEDKIAALRAGQIPFHEPDLPELVARNAAAGRLSFTARVPDAVRGAQVVFVAVGTPPGPEGHADLRQVLAAAEAVGRALDRDGVLIVTKSTVPVGTTDKVRDAIGAVTARPFSVASNPEFLKEGDAVRDVLRPDRVVVGVSHEGAAELLRRLYGPFVRDPVQILTMGIRSAELTKYAANAMLATRISFMNEMANLCEALGANVDEVRHGVGADARIGGAFLYPGCSFGGSCFSKDLQALLAMGKAAGAVPRVAEAALCANRRQRQRFVAKIARHLRGELRGRTIGVWGLSFKPGTDDLRDAPALDIVAALRQAGAQVQATDPAALSAARHLLPEGPDLLLCEEAEEAARGAEALVLVTEWRAYRQPDWGRLSAIMAGRLLFDGRNVWDRAAAEAAGFSYHGVGR